MANGSRISSTGYHLYSASPPQEIAQLPEAPICQDYNPDFGYVDPDSIHGPIYGHHYDWSTADINGITPAASPAPSVSADLYLAQTPSKFDSSTAGPSGMSSSMPSPALNLNQVALWSQPQPYPAYQVYHYFDPSLMGTLQTSASAAPGTEISGPEVYNAGVMDPYSTPFLPSPAASPLLSEHQEHVIGPIRTGPKAGIAFEPYHQRSRSVASAHSHASQDSTGSGSGIEGGKVQCPHESCGKYVRDIKSHMLTHGKVRPEKCPKPNCPYHTKGFARKYDMTRHSLTHYRGSMVCDFCPGSDTLGGEKAFNRTDVFKRHLQSVHGVQQTTASSKNKAHGTRKTTVERRPGVCSDCGVCFSDAQEFHDHVDECALRIIQRHDPGEEINERLLSSVANNDNVKKTLAKNNLPVSLEEAPTSNDEDSDEDADHDTEPNASH